VAYFFEPLLEAHDRATFEVFCYAAASFADDTTRRLQAMAPHWQFVAGIKDADLQRQVRADGIDILVELAGHTANTRIDAFAPKPAPVTLAWLGYPTTSGLPTIDYRITDGVADPPGEADRLHTETLVRLPNGFLCYRPPAEAPEVAPPAYREQGHITFGSFNAMSKVNGAVVAAWARILTAVPGSRLLLKGIILADEGVRQHFLDQFAQGGASADRIELLPRTASMAEHLAGYGRINIGLDPFPYNGTTTTCEALWMGVPVVTLRGDRHSARVGASLLSRLGLEELVAGSPEDYVGRAIDLAGNPDQLEALRVGMRARMRASPLRDEPGFARQFEAALRDLWRRWCAGTTAGGAPPTS
jgi:predicted O-linked N-acetylglucosamine transferase (SPINDLY family)